MLLQPLSNLTKMLVLFADVILLTQVDKVDDRLGSKKEQGVDGLDLLSY
jgi:hypothetical protein